MENEVNGLLLRSDREERNVSPEASGMNQLASCPENGTTIPYEKNCRANQQRRNGGVVCHSIARSKVNCH